MKAAVVDALGQTPVYTDFTEPAPREGAVVVTVEASALTNLTRGLLSGNHYASKEFSYRLSQASTGWRGWLTAGWCTPERSHRTA